MRQPLSQRFARIVLSALLPILALAPAAEAADAPLVAARSVWKYLDNGSNQGTAWREPAFDDSSWASGTAELGYGDGDESTVVSYGPDATRRHITTYFRQSFSVADPAALTALTMRLIRDDGAVVYLNGREVWRVNMPTGTISYTTLAPGSIGSTDETTWLQTSVDRSLLVAGTNVVAVEMHQASGSSSDLSFALEILGNNASTTPVLTRGPYLQSGTPTSVVVRWRTDISSESRVRYGTSPGNLIYFADGDPDTSEHIVTLTGLTPQKRYYYAVGTSVATVAGDDATHTFVTAPEVGKPVPTRIWVLGDSGTGGTGARAVRNAYQNFASPTSTNLWLMLGDNAYDYGTDDDYQKAVFNMYPEMLRASVLWPAIGNHDTAEQSVAPPDLPYFKMFTLPTRGEAGGVASGTESYYSFDYGDIHFVCLDSMTSDRSPDGPMLTWLRNDLASTNQRWLIAFWHHPPYSKGSHDSDVSSKLIEMRRNAVPILEDAGVDLILSGHSHSYERSFLLDGHYGYSNTLTSSMKIDGGSGRVDGSGAYRKPGTSTHEGAVYVVAGSSGLFTGGPLNHPAMFISINNLGSMVLDVRGDQMDVKFLRETGAIDDYFTIVKGTPGAAPAPASSATAVATSSSSISVAWQDASTDEDGFRIERCSGASCTSFVQVAETTTGVTSYSDTALAPSTLYRYRIVAFNSTAAAAPSNVAEATTLVGSNAPDAPAALTATAASTSQIDLGWTDGSSNEDGFRVERCSGAACTNFALVTTLAANVTAYSDTGLTGATLYRYRVLAYNADGPSQPSNVAEATTQTPPPSAPGALTATAVSSSEIRLTWTDTSTNEQGFRLERCSGTGCTNFVQIAQLNANTSSYSNTLIAAQTVYRYRMTAYNAGGTSAPSNVAEATTKASAPPAAPTSLSGVAISRTQINLTWTDNATNEDTYYVERCRGTTCTSFAVIAKLGANATSFASTGLTRNTVYRYRVRAQNTAGYSTYSNIVGIRTK